MVNTLFDFASEKNLDEAFIFYFVTFIIGYYIAVSLGLFLDHIHMHANFLKFLPPIYCTSIAFRSILTKNLKGFGDTSLLINSTILPFIVAITVPFYCVGLGLCAGLIPATILTTREDNNFYLFDAIQKKEALERRRMIEKQLIKEQAITLRNKEIEKIRVKDYVTL